MNKILIVSGPTATGKTKLAIELAEKFNGELVNADSRQVYRGLDALTGKDRSTEAPIHLYDIVDPEEEYSVARFVKSADVVVENIQKRGKLPIVVGGTGFYLRALTRNIDTIFFPPNQNLRKRLAVMSVDELQSELQRTDPAKWNQMNRSDQYNPRRLVRAIEVAAVSGSTPQQVKSSDVLWIGLTSELPELKNRIDQRVGERFEKALLEVRDGLPPILGAGPLLLYKRGLISREDALTRWAQAEYQYAKRQLTWFRKEKDIVWFDIIKKDFTQKVEECVAGWYTN